MDLIERQAAISAVYESAVGKQMLSGHRDLIETLKHLPPAQPETCGTCKHGYFGDKQCNDCRVRFTSHYERRNND